MEELEKKERDYRFDNIKCIMIFFVVLGHFLELFSGNISKAIYIFIYTFHMPVFIFITGYFGNVKRKIGI